VLAIILPDGRSSEEEAKSAATGKRGKGWGEIRRLDTKPQPKSIVEEYEKCNRGERKEDILVRSSRRGVEKSH